ncbi:MAG: hypothetical protein HY606_09635 [Planctomycetes bacterium]|nr:hypothetical protein [Planctomycetota bacterium]
MKSEIKSKQSGAALSYRLDLDVYGNRFAVILKTEALFKYLENEFRYFLGSNGSETYVLFEDELPVRFDSSRDSDRMIRGTVSQFIYSHLRSEYLLIHGSCVAKKDRCYLFIGQKCSGKSTAALLGKLLGYEILSDEVLLFKRGDPGQIYAFPHNIKVRAGTHLVLSEIMPDKYSVYASYYPKDFHVIPNIRSAQVNKICLLQHTGKHPAMYIYDNLIAKSRETVRKDLCEITNILNMSETAQLQINLTNGRHIWKSFDLLTKILS